MRGVLQINDELTVSVELAQIGGYTRRPYHDVIAMADGLAERWNLCVKPDDQVQEGDLIAVID